MDTFLKILSLVMAGCAAALLLWGVDSYLGKEAAR